MAQRRMSRKSFRKSKGRKNRSMRKRTMGGAVDVKKTVDSAFAEFEKTGAKQNAIIEPLTATGMFSGITGCGSDNACQIEKAKDYALAAQLVSGDMKSIIEAKLEKHATEADLNLAGLKIAAEEKVSPVRQKFEDEKAEAESDRVKSVAASKALAAKSKAQEELDATERIYDYYVSQNTPTTDYYASLEDFCRKHGNPTHLMNSVTSGNDKNKTICNVQMSGGTAIVRYTLKGRLTTLKEFKNYPDGRMRSDTEIHLRDHCIDKIDEENPLSKIIFYVISGQRKTTLPIKMYMPSSEEVEQYKSKLQEVINSASGGRKTRRRRNKKSRKTRRR